MSQSFVVLSGVIEHHLLFDTKLKYLSSGRKHLSGCGYSKAERSLFRMTVDEGCAKFEVLIAVLLNIQIFCDVVLCCLGSGV
jgi:hypothetical protein